MYAYSPRRESEAVTAELRTLNRRLGCLFILVLILSLFIMIFYFISLRPQTSDDSTKGHSKMDGQFSNGRFKLALDSQKARQNRIHSPLTEENDRTLENTAPIGDMIKRLRASRLDLTVSASNREDPRAPEDADDPSNFEEQTFPVEPLPLEPEPVGPVDPRDRFKSPTSNNPFPFNMYKQPKGPEYGLYHLRKLIPEKWRCNVEKTHGIGKLGPAIIGGIGDSGTRGAKAVLENAGFSMCPARHPDAQTNLKLSRCNKAGDNVNFMWGQGTYALLASGGDPSYEITNTEVDAATHYMMCGGIYASRMGINDSDVVSDRWGWKIPRSIYYLPYLKFILKDKFRYIHVLRDGRDIITGDNQRQMGLCPYVDLHCQKDSFVDRIKFWELMNMRIFRYANLELSSKNYFLLRIEDIALNADRNTLEALLRFLHVEMDSKEVSTLLETCKGHESSYGGQKLSSAFKEEVLNTIGSEGKIGLEFFGYDPATWGTIKPAPQVDPSLEVPEIKVPQGAKLISWSHSFEEDEEAS